MILNTGARTDTVQYYSDWLLNRFEEGYVLTRNPLFPKHVSRYVLTPDKIDLVMFCSKNYEPILPRIKSITERFKTLFHYTITAYGIDIEPRVPSIDKSIETLSKLSEIVGKEKIIWRYDPVLLTENYTIDKHIKTFEKIAKAIHGKINRCVFSFVEMYKKLQFNMPELIVLSQNDKEMLACEMGKIAAKYDFILQTCGMDLDYAKYGINTSGCVTASIIEDIYDCKLKSLAHSGMRQGCHCIPSRDIGAYDTCPNGCKYCYANKTPEIAIKNYKSHDPLSPLLIGSIEDDDIIKEANQRLIIVDNKQISFWE